MTSPKKNEPSSHPSTFPRFSDLAAELRIQIWQHALPPNRVIPVQINHHPAVTVHSCVPLLGSFCGQHDNCPSHEFGPNQPPSSKMACVFNGYFSLPHMAAGKEDDAVLALSAESEEDELLNLSLVCTESRSVVVMRYPEKMTIYTENCAWFPGMGSHEGRLVRCNPATDTLVVKSVPNYPTEQRHPSPTRDNPEDAYHEGIGKWFPSNPEVFASFRSIISSFRHVVLTFLDEYDDALRGRFTFSTAFDDRDFQQFLTPFERLEHLDMYEERGTAAIKWERMGVIGDPHDDAMDHTKAESFAGVSGGILNWDDNYNNHIGVQGAHSAGSGECCWVPTPKGFGGSWLFRSRYLRHERWWEREM